MCRGCGAGAPLDAHFCPQCSKILALGRHGDYFAFMGLPRKLRIDPTALEQRFRSLSRQFHPDYFYNAEPAERRASLERSSYLNDAYRTLRNPVTRLEYLLRIEGIAPGSGRTGHAGDTDHRGEASKQVPPALLEEVFALNEELDEIRELRASGAPASEWTARLLRARGPIDAKRAEHESQIEALSARWDTALGDMRDDARDGGQDDGRDDGGNEDERRAILRALGERLLERNYINNLLMGIEREQGPPE